jgi:hypothetical protein
MAVLDIRSDLQPIVANVALVTGNGTTNGAAIDTAQFELGMMFVPSVGNFTDGVYDFVVQASEDNTFATGVTTYVDGDDELIGTLAGLQLIAASANSDILPTLGLFSNPRYVRINVVASGVTTGADVTVILVQKGENMAVV